MATMTASSGATGLAAENPHHERRWVILFVLAAAQLMVVLDTTVVNIALPSAQRALGFSDSSRQWIVTAYALAFGSLLLLGGRLADLFGRKRVFLVGLVGFAAASAVGGAATGFGMLVGARAVQGAFGALLAPAALSLLTTTFTSPKERAKAFGIYGAISGGGSAIGLLLGGFLTEYLSWRWCMYVNLIFAVAALIGGITLLHDRVGDQRPRLDLPGVFAVSAALFSVVYGFSRADTHGWSDGGTIGFLAAAVILLAAFVRLQVRSQNPLLPLRILADRNRAGAYTAVFLAPIGMFGAFLFLTYYMQGTLKFSALQCGLAFLPMTAAVVGSSILSNVFLATRVGPRWSVAPGMVLGVIGMLSFSTIGVNSSYLVHILPGSVIMGTGVGMIFSAALATATSGVRSEDAGVASALVSTGQQIGGSVGTALLNTLAASAVSGYLISHGTSAAAVSSAAVHGYVVAFRWSAGLFAIGAILCGSLLRGGVRQASTDTPALHV